VAVTASTPKLDARRLRADFPIFEQSFHGKPLSFLDSAASSQKPRQVLDAIREFYETSYTNVHRGVYELAERATAGYEGARERVARFVNAPSAREVIFTRNATEGINLVAYAWGLSNLGPGDVVLVTELEHHSNFVPWQYIAGRTGADFRMLPLDEQGELRLDALDEVAGEGRLRVVAAGLVSNSLGTVNPVERLSRWAHERGALMVCDAAQGAPHRPVDVQALGADFVAITAHKLCGPSGIGALWGRLELLEEMEPFNLGGHMIRRVRLDETTWGDVPAKYEAGTQPIAEAVGFAAAVDYVSAAGIEAIERHEHELAAYALDALGELPWVTTYGPPADRRAGIVSFNVDGVHPHDVSQILDLEGVAIRAGHHCCQPLMTKLGVAATNRASFYLYTVPEEIDRLVEGLHKVRTVFG
jgi:cysteine desulfurase / selenocysteine lyase